MSGETISVLVCTRNRADALAKMLARLPVETMAAEGCELIIVDNGSTDATPVLLAAFAAGAGKALNPSILREDRPGLSRARNMALRAAHGEILCFVDDDCYLDDAYFTVVRRIFADAAIGYAGGRILPTDPRGAGTGEMLETDPFIQPPRSGIWPGKFQGASMVVRREVFARVGLFDPALGAGAPFRCEDIEFAARASFHGFTGRHEPDLIVHHDHGRTDRIAIEMINRENDVAGGAYFMICLLRELPRFRLTSLRAWLAEKHARQYQQRFRRQVKGALLYLRALVLGQLRPYRAGTAWREGLRRP